MGEKDILISTLIEFMGIKDINEIVYQYISLNLLPSSTLKKIVEKTTEILDKNVDDNGKKCYN